MPTGCACSAKSQVPACGDDPASPVAKAPGVSNCRFKAISLNKVTTASRQELALDHRATPQRSKIGTILHQSLHAPS